MLEKKKPQRTYAEWQLEKKLKKLEQLNKVIKYLEKKNPKTKKPQNK